jgi:gliding motility-associated-like protein
MLLFPAFMQAQPCPPNINFSLKSLTHWFAYTGNNQTGNGPTAIKQRFDSTQNWPSGTINATTFYEYNLNPAVVCIQTLNTPGIDYFGGFSTIPTINGYPYDYSVILGSTAVNYGGGFSGTPGGYIRGISYQFDVPATPANQPYTMTYAYAMILENGTHISLEQPKISATISTLDSVITCASPSYYLPTLNNTNIEGVGATLDSAVAIRNGFRLSPQPSPNLSPNQFGFGVHLQDVWTKGWTEVTFDLSPYRGQRVTLNFEADNCIPGGHFAYAYIAIRNTCAGLQISGDSLVCVNSDVLYSVPALAGATYEWQSSWGQIYDSLNFFKVVGGNQPTEIIVHEQNSCANLRDTLLVNPSFPAIGGTLNGDATVCSGTDSSVLALSGYLGHIIGWQASTSPNNWTPVSDTTAIYVPKVLTTTTTYRALVVNGLACGPDSSSTATITVDPQTIGGSVSPPDTAICFGQTVADNLNLQGNVGSVLGWQSSTDTINWTAVPSSATDSTLSVIGLGSTTYYRVVVQSGVCPPQPSAITNVTFFGTPFPQATGQPAITSICYGDSAQLNAQITVGTAYNWTASPSYTFEIPISNSNPNPLPYPISTYVSPLTTTDFVLSVQNAGCPNSLFDTFQVAVQPPIKVTAGDDTSVVVGEPLQMQATANDSNGDTFGYSWTPASYLTTSDRIPNPVAIITNPGIDTIRYVVTATSNSPPNCKAENSILVRVFKTPPDIFVPNAFTPGANINTVFRPICVGISSLEYFKVFNRWGQLVFSTSQIGQGWDGKIGGKPQSSDTFVWMVQGTTYTGKTVFKKGYMVLVR